MKEISCLFCVRYICCDCWLCFHLNAISPYLDVGEVGYGSYLPLMDNAILIYLFAGILMKKDSNSLVKTRSLAKGSKLVLRKELSKRRKNKSCSEHMIMKACNINVMASM